MKHRSGSIGQSDLADALNNAVSIEQQRIEKLSGNDLDAVAGGGLVYTLPDVITGTGKDTGTVGMYPPPPTTSDGSSSAM